MYDFEEQGDRSAGGSPSARDKLLNRWLGRQNERSQSSSLGDMHHTRTSTSRSLHEDDNPARRVRSPYRRRRYWPPGPIVEDAVESLAKEYSSANMSDSAYESGDEPQVRGSIDQQPIILEAAETSVRSDSIDASSIDSMENARERRAAMASGPDDSRYAPTPKHARGEASSTKRSEARYAQMQNEPQEDAHSWRGSDSEIIQMPKRSQEEVRSRKTSDGQELSSKSRDVSRVRGRNNGRDGLERQRSRRRSIPRLDTNFDEPSLHPERRAPSPYSFVPTSQRQGKGQGTTSSVEQFLSPESYRSNDLPSDAENKRNGSYNVSRDSLREIKADPYDLVVKEGAHHERRRSGRYSFVNGDVNSSKSVEPSPGRRSDRPRSPTREPGTPGSVKMGKPFHPGDSKTSESQRERRRPGKIQLPDQTLYTKPRMDDTSDESEGERHCRRTRKFRSPLVTPDGIRLPKSEESYFNLPVSSHRRQVSGKYARGDARRLEELKSDELSFRQPSSPHERSRPSTPTLQSAQGLASPGLGSSSFPWGEVLPSSSSISSRSSRFGSRPGSSGGSTPPSPASSSFSSSPQSYRKEPFHAPRTSLDSQTRGRRSRPPSPSELSHPEQSITPRPRPSQANRKATLPPTSNQTAGSGSVSQPSTHYSDYLEIRPRIDVISPGNSRKTPSYLHEHDKTPTDLTPTPQPSPRSSRESSPISTARAKLKTSPLPPCPRPQLTRGHNDWYTLVNFGKFDICPSCLNDAIGSTPHRAYFVPSAPRPAGSEVKCDFSLPWVRVAWVLTLKQRRRNLDLVYATARIAATLKACPRATGADRQYYSVIHPDTGNPVANFDVCPCCRESLEALLPQLRGVFVKSYPSGPVRKCDLRFDSKRFLGFVDELEATAKRAARSSGSGIPDMRPFANYACERASMRECPGSEAVPARGWHIIPKMPDFTVCEECFHDDVWPKVESGSALADRFSRRLQLVASHDHGVLCRLASPRMKEVWRRAVERDDIEFLKREVKDEIRGSR
ncbi:MAG: hypothetical protein M1837_003247 [Sclerophora amabilis]|nr:MAG: hypothetical protein M1837_003247 [Sclerophora amabilis]